MERRVALLLGALMVGCPSEEPASLFADEAPTEAGTEPTGTPEAPTPVTAEPPAGPLRFDDVTASWGLAWTHHAGRNAERWLPETMGGGVAVTDFDRNGAPDVLYVDGGELSDAADASRHTLFLGDGKGGFRDVTDAWGLTTSGYGMGVATGDVDGDGWTDVYLTTWGSGDRLLRNMGGERFEDVTDAWGLGQTGWGSSAAFFDADGDGDLDLYVVRYVDYTLADAIKCWFRTIHIYCTPTMYPAQSDLLYRNDGGRFTDVSAASGVAEHLTKGLALGTGDLDGDGDTDLYVATDTTRNLLLMNEGGMRFEERGLLAGVAYSALGREESSMGVAITDADQDGHWDMAVTNFQSEPTSVYFGRSGTTFREQSDRAGVGTSSRARLSFGIEFFDADNDGDDELITANGHIADNVAEYRDGVVPAQLNSLLMNDGGRFTDVSAQAGSALAHRGVSRGLAIGDLDSDGGLDVVVVNNEGPAIVGANRGSRGHWLSLWLEGAPARDAIGAVVSARVGERTVTREVRGATSYLSVSDRRVHLGLGDAATVDELEVRWPGGDVQRFTTVAGDRFLRLVQGGELAPYAPGAAVLPP